MKKVYISTMILLALWSLTGCDKKSSDHYYEQYLKDAELAKPAQVDSLQILPGNYRVALKFKVGGDRRINKLRVQYNTSLSSELSTVEATITDEDYGNYKEILISNIPEATLFARATTFEKKGDSSNVVQAVGVVYGDRYRASLGNRIFQNISSTSEGVKVDLLPESGAPQDTTGGVFYTLQKTIITYQKISGDTGTREISPYTNTATFPDMELTGSFTHRSVYKPTKDAIDNFYSDEVVEKYEP